MQRQRKRPPSAGIGRKTGTPNTVTREVREMFSAFVSSNAERVQELFDRVARKNPGRALELLTKFAEFVLPRLERMELDATVTQAREYPDIADMDPLEAARVYAEVMRAPAGSITFQAAEAEGRHTGASGVTTTTATSSSLCRTRAGDAGADISRDPHR